MVKNRKLWSKIEHYVKNPTFGQKTNFWSKIELLVKNRNFRQKSKLLSWIELWPKIEIMVKTRNVGKKSKLSHPRFLVRKVSENLGCSSKSFSWHFIYWKIECFSKSKFWWKIEIFYLEYRFLIFLFHWTDGSFTKFPF